MHISKDAADGCHASPQQPQDYSAVLDALHQPVQRARPSLSVRFPPSVSPSGPAHTSMHTSQQAVPCGQDRACGLRRDLDWQERAVNGREEGKAGHLRRRAEV